MTRIPVRFQRVAAAFNADVARMRLCESSGSEHSPETFTDLSDLVNTFMETTGEKQEEQVRGGVQYEDGQDEQELEKPDSDNSEMLRRLFYGSDDDDDERDAREKIRREVEVACGVVGNNISKRELMNRLRGEGFDAGLCKSKWEKNGRLTAGDYEYIDVNFKGKRYIVETSFAGEFEIARPTNQYSSLLDVFPLIFVGKVEELNQVVRLMCTAIKGSMKNMNLQIPPWRRNVYIQAKWFSAYKRTTNAVTTKRASSFLSSEALFPKRSIGFELLPGKAHDCRDVYGTNTTGFRIGHLTAVFNADTLGV